jgi:hypothetical protein
MSFEEERGRVYLCLGNCTDCDPISSFCELINRLPVCQCKKGYIKIANG